MHLGPWSACPAATQATNYHYHYHYHYHHHANPHSGPWSVLDVHVRLLLLQVFHALRQGSLTRRKQSLGSYWCCGEEINGIINWIIIIFSIYLCPSINHALSSFISFYTRPSDSELLQHYIGAPRSSWGPSWCQQSCGDEDLLMESDSASGSLLAESKCVEVWIFLWWILTCITLALFSLPSTTSTR